MRKPGKPGKVVGLKVETHKPEEEPQFLAMQLADALQSEMNARQDAFEYRAQAQRERQKAKTMINTLVMLQEYNKFKKDKLKEDPDWEERAPYDGGPSRMEPMRFYSEDDIKKQKVEAIERARKFEDLANKYEQIAKDKKRLQAEIQKKLKNPSRTSVFYPMKER